MAIFDWMQGTPTKGPPWPEQHDDKPVAPAFLTHLRATDMEGQIVVTMLESAEIPVVTQYPNNGSFGRVVLGFSGTGVDLYVPETMLEDAKALIEHQFDEEDFDHV